VPSVKFDAADFDTFFAELVKLLPAIKASQDRELISDLVSFRNIVMTLKSDNHLETMKRYFNYLSPFHKRAHDVIGSLRKIFVQKIRELRKDIEDRIIAGKESDPETKKLKKLASVYNYWKKNLNASLSDPEQV